MRNHGELRIDPSSIGAGGDPDELEIVVLHLDAAVTPAVLKRAGELTAGLNARIVLLAVQTVPFPASYASAAASHAHLVAQLLDLADACPVPVAPHVLLARGLEEGVRYVLKEESTVLIGTRRHRWKTPEERLARALAEDGHNVALVRVEREYP
jgi:hypothetical protein